MFNLVVVLLASALLIEGLPFTPDVIDAAKNGKWDQVGQLLSLNQRSFGDNWPSDLTGNVESLRPSDGTQVYGHSVASYKTWHEDNGKVTEEGKGVEVINNNGQISKRVFTP